MKITITLDTKNLTEIRETINFLGQFEEKKTEQAIPESRDEQIQAKKEKEYKDQPLEVKEVLEPSPVKTITLAEVKNLAQEKAKTLDKNKVKELINKYATKLAEVKEADYEALYNDLQEYN